MTPFERIKETSKNRGYSLQDTARLAGIGINTIYGWKRYTPASDKLQAVADVLGVTVDYLLGNEEKPADKKPVDLDSPNPFLMYQGKEVSQEDIELFKRLLRGGRDE